MLGKEGNGWPKSGCHRTKKEYVGHIGFGSETEHTN